MARSGSSLGSQPLVPGKFWSAIVSVQLLLLVNTAMASRILEQQTSLQRRQFQAFSDDTNKPRHAPAVQSFLVSDGTWVDCIPIEGQISAPHPALKDHVIQMMPSPSCRPSGRARSEVHPQLFAREHGGCPEGCPEGSRAITLIARDLSKTPTPSGSLVEPSLPSYTVLGQNAQTESEVEIEVLYDGSSQNWWLFLNTDPVGYWPASIFNGRLQGSARLVRWGGEVFIYKGNTTTLHSNTAMGSGAFPSAGYPKAAYHKKITYADATGSTISPDPSVLDHYLSLAIPVASL